MADIEGTSGSKPATATIKPGSSWANAALLLLSVVLSLAIIEFGYRVAAGLPMLEFVNWRAEHIVRGEYKAVADPELGWTLKPWDQVDGYTTIAYGIRPNFDERTVRTGGVFAVGDSFTQGWEVDDNETWPAYLERLTEVPVVNAGVGGYGTDQIILRAERLLPIVKPKILIVGFLEADVFRTGHSVFGAPKPYFTIEAGSLRYHPPEFQAPRTNTWLRQIESAVSDSLGYSAAADFIMSHLVPTYWQSARWDVANRRADNDPVEVTCALLRRLKARTDDESIPVMLLMQHHAMLLFDTKSSTPDAQRVAACAQAAGIRVVDQFAPLQSIIMDNPYRIAEFYAGWDRGAIYGHLTAKGNEHAARLVANALREWLPKVSETSTLAKTFDETP